MAIFGRKSGPSPMPPFREGKLDLETARKILEKTKTKYEKYRQKFEHTKEDLKDIQKVIKHIDRTAKETAMKKGEGKQILNSLMEIRLKLQQLK